MERLNEKKSPQSENVVPNSGNEKDLNPSREICNEMAKVRIWIDPYWKRDEHGRRISVRGHWKTIDVEPNKLIRFPYRPRQLIRRYPRPIRL